MATPIKWPGPPVCHPKECSSIVFFPYLAASKNVIYNFWLCFQQGRTDKSSKKKVMADNIIQMSLNKGLLSSYVIEPITI